MNNYRLVIMYDGGRYDGWQRMGKDESDNTISVKIIDVLKKMTGEDIELNCGQRTEKGVHAYGQVANIKLNANLDPLEVRNYLNRYLPKDIAVTSVERADERFHAQLNAKAATYIYKLDTANIGDVFIRKYSYHTFDKPDLKAMKEAAEYFVGTHDFKQFTSAKKSKSTTKTIHSIDIVKEDEIVIIRIKANDFMHNMARLMVGTLLDVGNGLKKSDIVKKAMDGNDITMSFPAEACGLYLESVEY